MNPSNHPDDPLYSDQIFNAVTDARKSILSVPDDQQRTAFDILVTWLGRDIGPPTRYAGQRPGSGYHPIQRRSRRSYRR